MKNSKQRRSKTSDNERRSKAIEWLMSHEGGYVNHPDDPGGETNFGITKRTYPDINIKSLTKSDAADIYARDFWDPYGYAQMQSDQIAFKVFDISVNVGSYRAQRMLQIVLRKDLGFFDLETDGVLGPITAERTNEAVGKYGEDKVLELFNERMERYYRSLGKPMFINGWLNRLNYSYQNGSAEAAEVDEGGELN